MSVATMDRSVALKIYRDVLMTRQMDERLMKASKEARFPGFFHPGVGQEAIPAAAIAHLRADDCITTYHRSRGYYIAKGADTKRLVAELFGKSTGYSKGKGGHRFAIPPLRIFGSPGTIGSNFPIAVGLALSCKCRMTDQVVMTFFGDGASNQGTFHEGLNLASVWKLPVVFVCENNTFAEFTRQERHQNIKNIADRAAGYGIPGVVVDGMDVTAVYDAAGEAVKHARSGQGPTLIEAKTYRFLGHSLADDGKLYRTQEEVDSWKARDPVPAYRDKLMKAGLLTEAVDADIQSQIRRELDEAFRFAEDSPLPSVEQLYRDVY